MKTRCLKYAVVIERTKTGYSAYPPDLPGCGMAASSLEEVESLIREAIEFHTGGLQQHGQSIPEPTSLCEYVDAKVEQAG